MPANPDVAVAARQRFEPAQIQAIRRTIAKDCSESEFVMLLEVAARYQLDPFAGEIYAAKMPGRNGGQGSVAIIVGRNGLLKIAKRDPEYLGVDCDVVHEKDAFHVKRTREGREIIHDYEGSTITRGAIVGAWAEVHLRNRRDVYFYAPVIEYRPVSEKKLQFSPWGSQESVMILKCAVVSALRLAIDIGGVYDEAELARAVVDATPPSDATVDWGDGVDEALAVRLRMLVDAANEAKPDFWRPAKVAAKLGSTPESRLAFAHELEDFIVAAGGTIPDPPVEGDAVEEPEAA